MNHFRCFNLSLDRIYERYLVISYNLVSSYSFYVLMWMNPYIPFFKVNRSREGLIIVNLRFEQNVFSNIFDKPSKAHTCSMSKIAYLPLSIFYNWSNTIWFDTTNAVLYTNNIRKTYIYVWQRYMLNIYLSFRP